MPNHRSGMAQGVDLTSKFPRSHHIRQLVLMSRLIGVRSGIRSVTKDRFTFLLQFVCIGPFQSMSTLNDMMHMVGSASPPLMMSVSSLFISSKANCHYLNACLSVYFSGCRERCGVIKIRQPGVQRHWRERETVFQNGPTGLRRLTRKRYIDLGNEQTHGDKL